MMGGTTDRLFSRTLPATDGGVKMVTKPTVPT